MFKQMVQSLGEAPPPNSGMKITQEQYDQWQQEYIFGCLQGARYGEHFCIHFGIVDYILIFSNGPKEADRYIQQTYIL
jgi:hypothetical protein